MTIIKAHSCNKKPAEYRRDENKFGLSYLSCVVVGFTFTNTEPTQRMSGVPLVLRVWSKTGQSADAVIVNLNPRHLHDSHLHWVRNDVVCVIQVTLKTLIHQQLTTALVGASLPLQDPRATQVATERSCRRLTCYMRHFLIHGTNPFVPPFVCKQ